MYPFCKKIRQPFSVTCTHRLGRPPIYQRLSSFPLQPAHSFTPVTLASLWQRRDASDCSILAACLPQWWRNLPTAPPQPWGSSTAIGARESERVREGGREGESVPLNSSAVTTPNRPGKESAPLTSPTRSAAWRNISSVLHEKSSRDLVWRWLSLLPPYKLAAAAFLH